VEKFTSSEGNVEVLQNFSFQNEFFLSCIVSRAAQKRKTIKVLTTLLFAQKRFNIYLKG
jgi:hypothetical protein